MFTLPVVAALALLQRRTREPWWPLGLLVLVAFTYTTPWDNYLVQNEVWTYPPGAVLFTIGYVPVEEYAFFIIQTVMTGLLMRLLQAWRPADTPPTPNPTARIVGTALFASLSVMGWVMVAVAGQWLYLGLILGWACPILTLMWSLGGHVLLSRWRVLAWGIVPMTLYLWAADWYAITQAGIWDITDATRTGVELAGLPVEEALFFLVTNMMVAQGLVMLERPAIVETVGRLTGQRPQVA